MTNLLFLGAVILHLSCFQQNETRQTNPLLSDSCDDPDAAITCCFQNIPANLNHKMSISHNGSGTAMVIKGKIVKASGSPLKGVILYAYHTDEKGIYSKSGKETGIQKWHGQHHGWSVTNDKGEYEIHSIRPAKYPNSNGPAHIHAAVQVPGNSPIWISDFVFKDDPAVKEGYKSSYPGGSGVVDMHLVNGQWQGMRDIILNH